MNTIKRVGVLSTLLGCLFSLPGSLTAQAEPYQAYLNGVCGPPTPLICKIDFPRVPAGKRLVISNTSCYLRVSNPSDVYALQLLILTPQGGIVSALTYTPQSVDFIQTPAQQVYSVNHSIFAFANARQHFQVYAELKVGTFSQLACHISGDMQDLP